MPSDGMLRILADDLLAGAQLLRELIERDAAFGTYERISTTLEKIDATANHLRRRHDLAQDSFLGRPLPPPIELDDDRRSGTDG